ncbi:C39 family peptidase [Caulobacter sp. 17J80-11]|nr:C39 family peptidase [Caulobacter sp. 17J80-11]
MRQDKVVVQKFDLSCGAAALATILNYQHGDHVTEKEIARGLISRKEYIAHPELVRIREGFSMLDLKRYVSSRGYEGVGFGKLTLRDLITYAPMITPMNFIGYNHFVVVTGVRDGTVYFADPAFGNRTMPAEAFEKAWINHPKMGRVGFVVRRTDGREPPNQLGPSETIQLPPESVLRIAVSPLAR